jgi:acyl-CoA synthetase (AMP-forming)/AMP-acid ligase II
MVAFLACLKAGVVAVPVFPPHPSRRDSLGMFGTICAACRARFALTNAEYNHGKKLAGIKDALNMGKARTSSPPSWPELAWIVTDNTAAAVANDRTKPHAGVPSFSSAASPEDVAFLQFTSGSTSDPKGVMITFGNLAHNLSIITSELSASYDTVVVSWLPQYHDMGLIGTARSLVRFFRLSR